MESEDEFEIERKEALTKWLSTYGFSEPLLHPIQGDASFRRYFRLHHSSQTFMVMDAPPLQENCTPYIAIANALRARGLHTPEIIHADLEQGFLLVTDFGDATYLRTLNEENADVLYRQALSALAVLRQCNEVPGWEIQPFTREFMRREWAWHKHWFLELLLELDISPAEKMLDHCYNLLVESAATQPQVFMHRDFHSANLMVLPNQQVGILDFQDAFIGPVTYDLASLLRDCYIGWPTEQVNAWVCAYWETLDLPNASFELFLQWFDWMSMQRHLKALFTFARKHIRDDQSHYLGYIPRTLQYLVETTERYPVFAEFHQYLKDTIVPTYRQEFELCVR